MKKILTGAALAAMALLASCNSLELPQEPVASGASGGVSEQTYFTATLDAQTKTYLESEGGLYKTYWSEGDVISVYDNDTGNYEDCPLVEGAGTTTGKFAGSIQAKNYVAVYGESFWREEADCYGVYMSTWPDYNENGSISMFDKGEFPMMAKSTGKTFSFKNLCSVLKVNVTGEGEYLYTITVTPNDGVTPVAGDMRVLFNGTTPSPQPLSEDTGSTSLIRDVYSQIGDTPLEVFIVLPAQTYPEGFTLRLETDEGEKDFKVTGNVELGRSRIRNLNLSYSEGLSTDTWGICGTMTEWGETEDIALTPEGEYYVLRNQYLAANSAFKFRMNGFWGTEYGAPAEGWAELGQDYYVPTNTKVLLEGSGGRDIYITFGGYYDIYLNPDTGEAFVMASGIDPASLPTMDAVGCYGYNAVANMSDDSMIALSGTVMEVYERGFLLDIKGYYNETILVYQTYFSENYSHIRPGNYIDLYATKNIYRDLPQVTGILWMHVWSDYETYYTDPINDLLDPADFAAFNPGRYAYVKYKGTLRKNGTYYNIEVDGVTGRQGSIEYPLVSLDEFVDKQVLIEGYFVGFSGSYMKTVLRKISFIQNDSSNEFITPGDDIILTGVQK